ncbi:MAG: type IV toxin-antitoxin system AbiEi family antitoxin domain-containing protein [Candidatus Nanopelagicales bacterium]
METNEHPIHSAALKQLPETFTLADARKSGIAPTTLYRLRDAGEVTTIARGLYRKTDKPADLDLLEIAIRAPLATICLTSALARYGLTDAIPSAIDIAIPRGTRAPATATAAAWHLFDPDTFTIGRSTIQVEGALERIGLYEPMRCIADAFRLRGTEGTDQAVEALRRWLRTRDAQPAALMRMAQQLPRAEGPTRQALEYLL